MSGIKVMLIDFNNFLDTSFIDEALKARKIEVIRPRSKKELVEKFSIDGDNWPDHPDFIFVLYYTFEQLTWLLPLLRQAESLGIRVVNSTSNLSLFADYPRRSQALNEKGFNVAPFYFGSAGKIPERLGEMVVWKSLISHQTILCPRLGIHSLSEPVYVESFIPNSEQRVLTIYWVAGHVHARWKEDPLQTKTRTRQLISDLTPFASQVEIVVSIAKAFGLVFLNVEFVGGHIIDVNTIANIFYRDHPEPLEALAEWIESF